MFKKLFGLWGIVVRMPDEEPAHEAAVFVSGWPKQAQGCNPLGKHLSLTQGVQKPLWAF